MPLKFLIDEYLSPELAQRARAAGHHQSTSVRDRGWSGQKDYQIMAHVVAEDFTLVTHNARDFRGDGIGGQEGLFGQCAIHAGLVCLTADEMDLEVQFELFDVVLSELANHDDLINQCLEVVLDGEEIEILYKEIYSDDAVRVLGAE